MTAGTVKWFNHTKGFGFITPDDGGKYVFVDISELERSGLGSLIEGQRVEFELIPGKGGKSAAGSLSLLD